MLLITYVINNNIAQYSVYLSSNHDDESKYRIEAYLFFNSKSLDEKYKIENYICLVKLLNLKTYFRSKEEIIEIKSIGTHSYHFDTNGKFIFEFSKNDFHSYKIDAKNFDIKNIVIGVIRREDYSKDMSEIEFNKKMNWKDAYLYEKISFPYSLINYQHPVLFNNGKELLKTVSSCVHFTYGRLASYLHNWIDIHLSLGISQIIFYDATPDYILTSFVQKNFNGNQVKVIQYRIKEEDLCGDLVKITNFPEIQELLKEYCFKFYENELLKKNTTLDKTLQRYFYFITEPDQRLPKTIHYSKNSRALFIHFPPDTAHGSWDLKPIFYDAHMLSHFREDWFDGNFEGSIQKLNIDFEYLFFIIKKFTSQC
jgi:hypothetical protein